MNKSMAVSVSGIVGGFITIIYIIAIISRFQAEYKRKRVKNAPAKLQNGSAGAIPSGLRSPPSADSREA